MKKIFVALLVLLASACHAPRPAQAQSTYNFTLNLSSVATGAAYAASPDFGATAPLIQSTWTDPNLTYQNTGDLGTNHFFHVVTTATVAGGACISGGKCLEFEYPSGGVGANPGVSGWGTATFQISAASANVLSTEYDLMLEPGFDLHGLGKLPVELNMWNDAISNYDTPRANWTCNNGVFTLTCPGTTKFIFYNERQSNGANNCTPVSPSWNLVTGIWYHIHYEVTYAASAVFKAWVKQPTDPSEVLILTCNWSITPNFGHTTRFEVLSHFGGVGVNSQAQNNSWWMLDNLHVYTGSQTPPQTPPPPFVLTPSNLHGTIHIGP